MPESSSFEQIRTLNNRPEMPVSNDRAAQRTVERPADVAAPRPVQRVPVSVAPALAKPNTAPLAPKSETLRQIEQVMQSGLTDAYKQMPPALQTAFRKRGEDTATQIEGMMSKVKVHTKKIFQLLFAWLKIIPGVNKYFLEQEAKLKTDEILRLKEEFDRRRGQVKIM